jgi:hypothetical protein
MIFLVQGVNRLQLLSHGLVDLTTRNVVGTNDDGVFWMAA